MSESNDMLIINGLKKGNDSLFQKFYLEEKERFLKWGMKESNFGQEEIYDFYQESQMYLYENILAGKLENLASTLRTYLYSIAKNQLRVKYKKMVIVQRHEETLCEHLIFLGSEENINSAKKEYIKSIADKVRQLKEPCKSLILNFYYENMSFKMIAKKMGYKSDDVAKSQKKRCMEKLRKQLN